ncbi:FAD-binding oxidoreductase [Neorhizobium galegae]|uniref:FAD-binding oxidoreductase n=1 Tax=Neorhizobium galegae TaxID=399 RepID=UPI0027D89279|nr:FAD-binding oxidoreductase [Neorhizobium galegae]
MAALREILGDRGILSGIGAESYEEGARFDKGKAAFVLRPGSTEELSKAVSYCVRNAIHIVPQAGNTGVVSASTPDASGNQVLLSVDRLNKTIELDADNRSVRVSAGVLLSDLNKALEPDGLFFPIDLGSDPRIGGMLATNTGGARFLKYGDVRRNVLGLTVVLADTEGTVLEFGRGLRKDNTGMDWKHIFIGTCGFFGIVTECVLNVERLPQETATALLVPAGSQKVMPLLRVIEDRFGADLTAFEGMSRNSISAALEHVPSLRNPFPRGEVPDYVVLLELSRSRLPREGNETLDSELASALEDIWGLDEPLLADAFIGSSKEMWALRHAISEGVKNTGMLVAFDLCFKRGDVMAFCDRIKGDLVGRFPDVGSYEFGHVGDGGIHFNLVAKRDSDTARDPQFERSLREWVYDIAVNEFGGSFSAEHGIGRKNQAFYDKYTPTAIRDMAKRLKEITSPGGLGAVRLG